MRSQARIRSSATNPRATTPRGRTERAGGSLKLDLAAARQWTGASTHATGDIGHHDARGSLAAKLARLFDRLLERLLDRRRKLRDRVLQRAGLDLETERQYAIGRQQLRLS